MHRSLIQFLESSRAKGVGSTLGDVCYRSRLGIVLENDLTSLGPRIEPAPEADLEFLQVYDSNFDHLALKYGLRSRYLKALKNLAHGYSSFAVSRRGEVLGDMWYAGHRGRNGTPLHPDLEWLKIDPAGQGVYLWDTYVNEEERSNSAAIYLLSFSLHCLRERGFSRAYGYVWADNKQARFLYRIFRFREIKRIKGDRFLFLRRARMIQNDL
jgi:ribosomal protein S18 acetylase RimI-like enzyme